MNQIICADALTTLKQVKSNSVDIVLTSPPYNFDMNYDEHNDKDESHRYVDTLLEIFDECIRTLKDGGRLIINMQPNYKEYFPSHHYLTTALIERGLIWRGEIVWLKNNLKKLTAWGSWMSPSCPYLSYPFEFIEVFSKTTLKHSGEKDNIDITKDEFIKYVNGHWTIAPETKMKEFSHPAMFPEELVKRCLRLFSYKDDLVLDPFNGVGTTTLVAHNLGRRYIGIDISEAYCNTAKQRIISSNPLEKFF
ncbi:site-specific DNA-methyltransferase [bacterium]|nr:site-specific DNA-methyltransferase [bacterium]